MAEVDRLRIAKMRLPSPERAAQVGIGILFIAILRTVGEYYRLRWSLGPEAALKAFEPFIPGLLLAIIGTMAAVALYFAHRFRLVAWAAGIVVAGLILYRVLFIPI
jgi:hypothetical protein